MGMQIIPVKLSLAESGAAALEIAAGELDSADAPDKFIAALDNNHRLWLTLTEIAPTHGWSLPAQMADFVLSTSRKAGHCVCDDQVEALIAINHRLSRSLAGERDLGSIRRRAELAWSERSVDAPQPLDYWLLGEMRRKSLTH